MSACPVTLVTGASLGIGRELARCAARDGHQLVLAARNAPRLEQVAAELRHQGSPEVRIVALDLARPGGAGQLLDALDGLIPDVLVNNAGAGGVGRFALERRLDDDLAMVQLNLVSLVELTGLLLPAMAARGSGGILNVASTAGWLPGPKAACYYASKAFVRSFSEALSVEARPYGVRVTALCPGPVDTGFAEAAGAQDSLLMRYSMTKVPAAKVARAGWDGLAAGRDEVIPGRLVQVAMAGLRVTPRRVAVALAGRLQN